MSVLRSLSAMVVVVALGLSACAPTRTNSTYSDADIGRTAQLSYGTIVSMRTVEVQSRPTGVGVVGGAVAGGVAGSMVGRGGGSALAALGGAVVGGLLGSAVEKSASTGEAVEFIIQEDNASQPISVVQTNEDNFRPGQRVVLSRGARTRIAHAN